MPIAVLPWSWESAVFARLVMLARPASDQSGGLAMSLREPCNWCPERWSLQGAANVLGVAGLAPGELQSGSRLHDCH